MNIPPSRNRALPYSEQTDPSGLIYMQARMYLPAYGRFASPDPAQDQHPDDPQSWNLYSYCTNNPITKTDPTGMWEWPEWVQRTSSLVAFGKWQTFDQNAKNVVYSQTPIGPDGKRQIDQTWGLNVNGEYIKQYDHRAIQDDSGSLLVLAGAAKLTGSLVRAGTEALTKEAGAVAADAQETTVIDRVKDLQNLNPGERSLLDRLPNQGSPKANWAQNSGVLREEMKRGLPIRDASPGDVSGQFLNAERNLLRDRGWTFDSKTNFWNPPVKQ